jgi:3-oxoacyl-[acyl-carrier protein] reductase
MYSINGKNIIVVGGSSGIGLEVSLKAKSAGANVQVISRNISQPLINEEIQHFPLDIKESFDLNSLALHETVDGLLYCPGSINLKPFTRFSLDDFQHDLQINVLGAVKIIQQLIPKLKKSGNASVVLFSTVAVTSGMSYHASISTAKGAVEGLTRSLAAEYAASGIRFNAIAPSLTDTPLAGALLSNDEKKSAAAKRHPLGKVGDPKEIAEACLFLLSNQSSWMTGQILHLDGGISSIRNV